MSRRRQTRLAALLAAALLALTVAAIAAAPAHAKPGWVVKGAGFGHGVGMSQWGAYGFAKRGSGYRAILAHYYTGTTTEARATKPIKVLLRSGRGSERFRGATSACGRPLAPGRTYAASRRGRQVILRSPKGRAMARCGRKLNATGPERVKLLARGPFRGTMQLRASGRGLAAINIVDIEDYVRGVVAEESPSSWPIEALKAQAVAARSYADSTRRGGKFDHYDDTRSQVYGGIRAETERTDRAVAATSAEVVLYDGRVAETYFSSTSGGHTEDNENSFLGGTPLPYLRGVPDPYDDASPYHRWKRKFSNRAMQARLGGLVKGRLRKVVVLRRGSSPRIVKARLVGTGGGRKVSGPTLRARLGLPDTWASFKRR